MKQALLALVLGTPALAAADPLPYCGRGQDFCECGALFAVLETADGDAAFVAALRERSDMFREQLYMMHGQTAGDRMLDAHIAALTTEDGDLQDAIDLAQRLKQCEPYLTGTHSDAQVLVIP